MRFRLAIVAAALLLIGCKPDPCAETACDKGVCDQGECLCLAGYDGQDCRQLSRSRLIGTYNVGALCGPSAVLYDCEISAGGPLDHIIFDNLDDRGLPVTAKVQGLAVDIPVQAFGTWTIQGSGALDTSAQELSLDYLIDKGGGSLTTCLISLYPQ
jgi:hypothetical protein